MAINVILKTENIPMKKESLKKFPGVTVKNALENRGPTQPATKCSKLTIKTLEQGVKYVQR